MSKRIKRRVALVVRHPSGYEDEIVRGAIDFAEQINRWTFVGYGHRPFLSFDQFDLTRADGVIGNFNEVELVEEIIASGLPAVNTSSRFADIAIPSITNDDHAIGRLGAEYLLERGFDHFGFLTVTEASFAHRRMDGFRQVIEGKAGRKCHTFERHEDPLPSLAKPIGTWLRQLPKPAAIMAANDTEGNLTIRIAVGLGLRVPEDVAVLGVDNDEWLTALAARPMSSVQTDARRIGYRAAQLLDRLMAGAPPPREPVEIPPIGVVTRRSTDIVVQADPVVARALGYIRDHCSEPIRVGDVLYEVGVSRSTLEMRMKRAIGQTPQASIDRARVNRAKKLLVESDQTMGRIAEHCGFERQEQFNRVFKRLTGLTPGQYRQQRR